MRDCSQCRNTIIDDEIVCSSCGAITLQTGNDEITCENHAGEPAIACCTMCGKPVCGDCATSRQGAFLCDAPEHSQHSGPWSVLAVAENPFEADMIGTNLVHAGFQPRVADPRNFAGTLGFRGRLDVRVLVEQSALEQALHLLRSSHLLNPES